MEEIRPGLTDDQDGVQGFTSSTLRINGGFIPEFFPDMDDVPSPISGVQAQPQTQVVQGSTVPHSPKGSTACLFQAPQISTVYQNQAPQGSTLCQDQAPQSSTVCQDQAPQGSTVHQGRALQAHNMKSKLTVAALKDAKRCKRKQQVAKDASQKVLLCVLYLPYN